MVQKVSLSIIIVSYNVEAFLEKCLESIEKASSELEVEVFVVDNCSVDGTREMITRRFPKIHFIQNERNVGFSKANNQALKLASGKYVLLLNPDTIISEDSLSAPVDYLEGHRTTAALGVRMHDGAGVYLPESKRGFPSPWVSFSKMTGLNSMFPKSKVFNGYYLGHLDDNQIQDIDVLCGAYMLIRKSVLDEIGFLDEDFFMYGEDIDLSYRIKNAGYKIAYFPHSSILHYKGESTKKGSLNYVKTFYNAMIIFTRKHFKGPKSVVMVGILHIAIYARAFISILNRILPNFLLPALDILLISGCILLSKTLWARYFYDDPNHFDENFWKVNLPLYTIIWVTSLALNGAYRKTRSIRHIVSGLMVGTLIILAVYGLLNLEYRSSRMVILLSLGFIGLLVTLTRWFLIKSSLDEKVKKLLIIADDNESGRIQELINRSAAQHEILGTIHPSNKETLPEYASTINQLQNFAEAYKADEIIFSTKDLNFQEITKWMSTLGPKYKYKISSDQSWQIIGSHSKSNEGELYGLSVKYNIDQPVLRRRKRWLDISLGSLFLLLSPILLLMVEHRSGLFSNLFSVIMGKFSWVGYHPGDVRRHELPEVRDGVLYSGDIGISGPDAIHDFNIMYAKDYQIWRDVDIIFRNFKKLGRRP